jgi:hypothetical protein
LGSTPSTTRFGSEPRNPFIYNKVCLFREPNEPNEPNPDLSAHTEAGLHFYEGVDVICDVGGQDIKIIILKNGRVKDFKLNTQCSAGNGYFLQSTAQGFNVKVEEYADVAFAAKGFPPRAGHPEPG